MATVKRPYGPWSRTMLARLRNQGFLKVEALVHWLAERNTQVDRTLVSHWSAGRTHLPADLLPLLAAFTGRPDLVYAEYLRAAHCDVIHIPQETVADKDLIDLMLEAGASLGRLQTALLEARSPASPGGETITAEERNTLRDQVDDLIQQLANLRAQLEGHLAPSLRRRT